MVFSANFMTRFGRSLTSQSVSALGVGSTKPHHLQDMDDCFDAFVRTAKAKYFVDGVLLASFTIHKVLIHGVCLKAGMSNDDFVASRLIELYDNHHTVDMDSAEKVYTERRETDMSIEFYNSYLGVYCNYFPERVEMIFAQMMKVGMRPNWRSFGTIMNALNHAGKPGTALSMLQKMQGEFQIAPAAVHYALVVDAHARRKDPEYMAKAAQIAKVCPFDPINFSTVFNHCVPGHKITEDDTVFPKVKEIAQDLADHLNAKRRVLHVLGKTYDRLEHLGLKWGEFVCVKGRPRIKRGSEGPRE